MDGKLQAFVLLLSAVCFHMPSDLQMCVLSFFSSLTAGWYNVIPSVFVRDHWAQDRVNGIYIYKRCEQYKFILGVINRTLI